MMSLSESSTCFSVCFLGYHLERKQRTALDLGEVIELFTFKIETESWSPLKPVVFPLPHWFPLISPDCVFYWVYVTFQILGADCSCVVRPCLGGWAWGISHTCISWNTGELRCWHSPYIPELDWWSCSINSLLWPRGITVTLLGGYSKFYVLCIN